jgi:hypothetical protein
LKMDRVFGIIPASSGAFTTMWAISLGVGVILIAVLGLFISFAYQARHATFTVTEQGLRIGPGLYGRFIPREDIDSQGVKLVNLNIDTEYRPKSRVNGAGFPGYDAGWFKLANKEKALAFVTDKSRVVYIPTNKDYVVLLSVRDAEEFAGLLQKWE